MKLYKLLWSKLLIYLLLFFALLFIGIIGYMLIEDYTFLDALYMTVITLASVGYAETSPLHTSGKIFTIMLIISNLGILTFVLAKVSGFLFDGEFRKLYKQLKMENNIDNLEGHVIVCGCGQNGREAIKELRKNDIEFVVIEKEENPVGDEILYYINDDATKDEVLLKAGIKNARAILITLPNDSENMFVVLTAKELNPRISIICRASKDTSVNRLKTAGANNIIMPDKLGGVSMANMVLYPDVKEFVDVMSTYQNNGNKISEIIPTKTQTLQMLNAWQNSGATILGIKTESGEYIINPNPAYIIDLTDRIIIIGNTDQTSELKKII
ncbi:MAG: potassium channel protein [Bacteroidota bacterium]|nr:potassium channel protein [Bacteroidota bacterium]